MWENSVVFLSKSSGAKNIENVFMYLHELHKCLASSL